MFILLFLYFCKKSWQYFVLLIFFLCELFFYFLIFYLFVYNIKIIINICLFGLYFLYNIFFVYINFYLYLCLYYFIASVNIFTIYKYIFIEQQNIFVLFFIWLFCFFLFKFVIYLTFRSFTKLLILFYFRGLNFYKKLFEISLYVNVKFLNFFYVWKKLTNFLRLKHYKASIFFLYALYIIIIAKLLLMNFNPVL